MITLLLATLTGGIASIVLIVFKNQFLKILTCRWYYSICVFALILFVVPFRFSVPGVQSPVTVPSFIHETQQVQTAFITSPPMTPPYAGGAAALSTVPQPDSVTPEMIFTALWLSGAVIVLIRYLWSYWKVKSKITKPEPILFYKGVSVHQSSYICSPMLIGFFHPRIVMPDYDDGGLEYQLALEHEYVHYRRGDSWCKLFAVVVSAIHWFNPIAHLAVKNIDRCCEYACDEAVTSNMNFDERKQYSETILKYICNTSPVLSSMLSKNKQYLFRRFELIMDMNKKSRKLSGGIAAATVLIFSILTTSVLFAEETPALTESNGGISTYYAINHSLEENVRHAFGFPLESKSGTKMTVTRFAPYYIDEHGLEIKGDNKNEVTYGVRLFWRENNKENSSLIQKTVTVQGKTVRVGFTEQALPYKNDEVIERMIKTQISFEFGLGRNSLSGDYDHTVFVDELIKRGIYVIAQVIEPQDIEPNFNRAMDGTYAYGNKILTKYDKKKKTNDIFNQKIEMAANIDGSQGRQLGEPFALQEGETLAIDLKEGSKEIDRINWAIVDADTGNTIVWMPNASVRERWLFIPFEGQIGKRVTIRVSAQESGTCDFEVFTYATDLIVPQDNSPSKADTEFLDLLPIR